LIANDKESSKYLVESIRMFPKQPEFAKLIEDAGFKCVSYSNLTGGIVAIHSGFKL
ncbi:MAG: class I SAM-dependent methyltransferase, partial [bacterium]